MGWTDRPTGGLMDRPTDGTTDGWTDGWTHPLIDLWGMTKKMRSLELIGI